jgi:hypothetical protein
MRWALRNKHTRPLKQGIKELEYSVVQKIEDVKGMLLVLRRDAAPR